MSLGVLVFWCSFFAISFPQIAQIETTQIGADLLSSELDLRFYLRSSALSAGNEIKKGILIIDAF
ncbi:MAG TPA: hypothetical protein VK155_08020 [Bacteroidales bacterium]|nr:hypothetical protein [Bacteroidales bacterium]